MGVIVYRTYDIGDYSGCRIEYGLTPDGITTSSFDFPPTPELFADDCAYVWVGYFPDADNEIRSTPVDRNAVLTSKIVAYNQTGAHMSVLWYWPQLGPPYYPPPSIYQSQIEDLAFDTPDVGGDPIIVTPYPEVPLNTVYALTQASTPFGNIRQVLSATDGNLSRRTSDDLGASFDAASLGITGRAPDLLIQPSGRILLATHTDAGAITLRVSDNDGESYA